MDSPIVPASRPARSVNLSTTPELPKHRPAKQALLGTSKLTPQVPSSRPKKVTPKELESDIAPVIPNSRPSRRVATVISADINDAKNDIHNSRSDTRDLDTSSIVSFSEVQTQSKTAQLDNDESEFDSSIPSYVVEEGNNSVKDSRIAVNANPGAENCLDDQTEDDSLLSSLENQNALTASPKLKNNILKDLTKEGVAHNHNHGNDNECTGCYTEEEKNVADFIVELNIDLDGINKPEMGLKVPNKDDFEQRSQVVEHDMEDSSKKETQKARNVMEANDGLLGDISAKEEEREASVLDDETKHETKHIGELKEEIKEELEIKNKSENETKFEGSQVDIIPEYSEENCVKTTDEDCNYRTKGLVSVTDTNAKFAVISNKADIRFPDNRLGSAFEDDLPLKNITSHQSQHISIDDDQVNNGSSDNSRLSEITKSRNINVDEKCISAASSEEPELPKSRPINTIVSQNLDNIPAVKVVPPKVPKKPSSKIAAFQEMLQQQQNAELGLLNKATPKIPRKRPSAVSAANESNLKSDLPDGQMKTVNRAHSDFAHNLNGLLGVGFSGVSLGANSFEALKHDKEGSSKDVLNKKKNSLKVPDARRSRTRGPRGRKLPEEVKKPVEVTNETLGNTLRITIQSLWSIDFRKINASSKAEETVDLHTYPDEDEGHIISAESNASPIDDAPTEQQTEASVENYDIKDIATEPISGSNLATLGSKSSISSTDEDIEKTAKDKKNDYSNTPNLEISDPILETLDESLNEPDNVLSENMEISRF